MYLLKVNAEIKTLTISQWYPTNLQKGVSMLKVQKLLQKLLIPTFLSLPIASLNTSIAIAGQQDFTVYNNNDLAIESLYVSSSKSKSWGVDKLGSDIIKSGDSFFVEFNNGSSNCYWDIKVIYEDGSYDLVESADLCNTRDLTLVGDGGDYN